MFAATAAPGYSRLSSRVHQPNSSCSDRNSSAPTGRAGELSDLLPHRRKWGGRYRDCKVDGHGRFQSRAGPDLMSTGSQQFGSQVSARGRCMDWQETKICRFVVFSTARGAKRRKLDWGRVYLRRVSRSDRPHKRRPVLYLSNPTASTTSCNAVARCRERAYATSQRSRRPEIATRILRLRCLTDAAQAPEAIVFRRSGTRSQDVRRRGG